MTNDDWLLTRRVYVDLLEIRSKLHNALDAMREIVNRQKDRDDGKIDQEDQESARR